MKMEKRKRLKKTAAMGVRTDTGACRNAFHVWVQGKYGDSGDSI